MTTEELQKKIPNYADLFNELKTAKGEGKTAQYLAEFEPLKHVVTDTAKRPDKIYNLEEGGTASSPVARLVVPFQKQIVQRAAAFLCGNPIELQATPEDEKQKQLLAAVEKIWEDNKLDYKSKTLAKHMMSETEAAELWFTEELEPDDEYWKDVLGATAKFRPRMRIIAPSLGDTLYPVYNPAGDMIAFGRGYTLILEGGKKQIHFDLYTAENIYEGAETDGQWDVKSTANIYKKIPVIYYSQPLPEWNDVQNLIDRYEKEISNLADTNDYFGSPMLAVSGKVRNFAKKGESGKIIELEAGASMEYVTWTSAPESVKMELEFLYNNIFDGTDTPTLTFGMLKGMGDFSGIALKMLFMAAHMKAADKEELFGESVLRRINYLKALIGVLDTSFEKVKLNIRPKFEYFLPKNDLEKLEMLTNATSAGLMSKETATRQNPLLDSDTMDEELARIKTDQPTPQQGLDDSFD